MRKLAITLGICLTFAAFGPAFAAPDAKTFVSDAITANNDLVKLGAVGQAKGRTTTQTFCTIVQRDYARANHDLETLAGTLGVTPPNGVSADVQAEVVTLSHAGDEDFDAPFGAYLVKVLEADIASFQAMADAKAGPASDLAAAELPKLQHSLEGAKRVAR